MGGQVLRDRAEQARGASQVEDPHLARVGARQQRSQLIPVVCAGKVDARVVQPGKEAMNGLIIKGVGGDEPAQFAAHFVAVTGFIEPSAGYGDDAGVGGELAVPVAQVQRGKKFSDGQIAGAAEYNEVTRCHGGRGRHEIS